MRRAFFLFVVFALLAMPLAAQIGKVVAVQAGSPEDRALIEIDAATDPPQKLGLLDKFVAEFGQGDMVLLAYDRYVNIYMAAKNYDKVFEYGDKLLAVDPDSFITAFNLARVAQEKGDEMKLFDYGERAGNIVQRFKARPVPQGTDPATWEQKKADTIADIKDNLNYVAYTLFTTALQVKDPAQRTTLLEGFVAAFPDSLYTENAQTLVATSYQQAQQPQKMLAFTQKVLAADPNDVAMLLFLADYWSERGEQLDNADEYAQKVLNLLAQAKKPEQIPEEQWQQQLSLRKGLAYSAQGEILVNRNRNPEAVDAFKTASPLLKANPEVYGRNLYRLGFTLAKMNRVAEARTVLTEAVTVNSPYRALAQETLSKISSATTRPARKRP